MKIKLPLLPTDGRGNLVDPLRVRVRIRLAKRPKGSRAKFKRGYLQETFLWPGEAIQWAVRWKKHKVIILSGSKKVFDNTMEAEALKDHRGSLA